MGHRFRRCSRTSTCTTSSTCGPPVAAAERARGRDHRPRFADDFVAGFEHREDAERFLRSSRQVREVRSGAASGEDAADRVRTVRRPGPQRRGVSASLRRSISWASRTSAGRTGAGGSSSHGSRARRRCAPSSRGQDRDATRMHHPIPEQGRWLASVLPGHYNYYAVPDNSEALARASATGRSGTGSRRFGVAARKTGHLEARCAPRRPMATPPADPAPLAQRALRRQNPREEPSALDAHAGICAGGRRQRRSLPVRPA